MLVNIDYYFRIPAHTVTMACISSNQAITTCLGLMNAGNYSPTVLAHTYFLSMFLRDISSFTVLDYYRVLDSFSISCSQTNTVLTAY